MLHERIEAHCIPNTKYRCPYYMNIKTNVGRYIYCDNLKPYLPKNIVGGKLL